MNRCEINSAHTAVYRSEIREKANQCSMASVQSESFQGSRCKTAAGATTARTAASTLSAPPTAELGPSLSPCGDWKIKNFQTAHARSTMVTRKREIKCIGDATEHRNDEAHPQHPQQHQHQHHQWQRRRKGQQFSLPNHHQHHHQNHRQENRDNEDDDDHLVVLQRHDSHHHHHRSQQPQHPSQEQHHLLDKCEKIKTRGICDLGDLRRISVCDKFVNNASETYSIRRHRYGTVSDKFYPTASGILVRLRRSRLLLHGGVNISRRYLFVHTVVSMLIIHLFTFSTLVSGLTHDSSSSGNQTFHLAAMAASLTSSTSSSSSSASASASSSSSTTTTIVSNSGNTPSASSSSSSSASSSSASSSSSSSGDSTMPVGIGSFISRENTIRREPNLSYTTGGCHSCRMREQVKADNLASIKRHILLRLELKTLPNITSPIVPREIIEKFYKTHNVANRSSSSSNTGVGGSAGNKDPLLSGGGGNKHPSIPAAAASSYDNMQGDDPRIYVDYAQNSEENESEDYEEEFFSVVNSLYVFPTIPRMRHNRKPDILHFSFTNNGHSSVSQAILHVYIRGRDWIRDYDTGSDFDNLNSRHEIIFTINRVLRRQNSPNSTHTQKVNEVRQQIPNGIGNWINVDVTEMVTNWFNNPNTNHGLVIKTTEQWMKQLVITDDSLSNKAYALYIEIQTKDNRKRRTKRNTSLNCSEKDNEERCCRYPLEVDFRKFDWDWIVAPTSFNAYFCNGECQLAFLPKYPHTHLMQLSTAPQPCCSPTKMSPLKLLYFNNDRNLVMSTIPNMAVDKCSCS